MIKIPEIKKLIHATQVAGDTKNAKPVNRGFASDLMSDVLTIDTQNVLLITGLNNLQTIRTAEMAEIQTIIFARDKKPTQEMIDLARKEDMILLVSEKSVFHISGLLYNAGLKPVF